MQIRSAVLGVYGEFVQKPYFVIVHSRPQPGHARFDQYNPEGLTELMLSVVEHVTGGRPEVLKRMCELDAADKSASPHRTRRYIAKSRDELYSTDVDYLTSLSTEYKGYWFGTNAKKTQTRRVIELACRAANTPYETIRKLPGFKSGA
ncbi:MAG: hypothetical protein AWT59_0765 [Candidatus Gallionella acididurans]|uniref:Uncharacterized protein n=1 Tax=Candidatus Gallionella acididurans TaxID=1796491 RepID=A0A139BW64_9PROT|nr:MAG: hypothetical protein AWT59_0765 [Candidatus Gallionella acididurans]